MFKTTDIILIQQIYLLYHYYPVFDYKTLQLISEDFNEASDIQNFVIHVTTFCLTLLQA